jgi:phosphate transport system substrate-binding protein
MKRGGLPARVRRSLAGVMLALGATSCRGAATSHDLTLAGSTSVQPVAERWAEVYAATHDGPRIHVQGGGSTAGLQAAESGAAQVGMCSRPLEPAEAAALRATVVARDGIALVVHPTNPLGGLDLAAVRRIYAGETKTWRDRGGAPSRITVITREEGSGTRGAFEELVMKGTRITAGALVQDSTGAVRQMVAGDPGAIGYVSLGLVDASVKALAIDGVPASEEAIDAQRYRLVRPFLLVTRGEPAGPVAAFISWVAGPEGAEETRRQGLLPPGR